MFGLCAKGVETEASATEIDGDAREAGKGKARKSGAGRERRKGTFEMAEVVNPAIVDLESEESAARAKHAEDFGEGEVLHFAGLEMVKDKNGNGGREGSPGEGQMRGIAAQHSAGMVVMMGFQFARGIVVVLQRGDAWDALTEMHGGSTIAGANL